MVGPAPVRGSSVVSPRWSSAWPRRSWEGWPGCARAAPDDARHRGPRGLLTRAFVSRSLRFVATYEAREGWEALGDPTRLAIVTCLAERPRAVGELAAQLPISRPAVSQ